MHLIDQAIEKGIQRDIISYVLQREYAPRGHSAITFLQDRKLALEIGPLCQTRKHHFEESWRALKIISCQKDGILMECELLQKLARRSITKEELLEKVKRNYDTLPEVLRGISSSKASVRYGCAKVLVDLSEQHPERLYPYMGPFIDLLDSKYRILTWNAMAIIANLTRVDKDRKFDAIFDKYYSFLNDEYMVTVANVVGQSGKIALAKPYLIPKITNKLLKVESISITSHLTEECKRVIAEKTIESFDLFFDQVDAKDKVISFVKRHLSSPRRTLKTEAENFLKKWCQ